MPQQASLPFGKVQFVCPSSNSAVRPFLCLESVVVRSPARCYLLIAGESVEFFQVVKTFPLRESGFPFVFFDCG